MSQLEGGGRRTSRPVDLFSPLTATRASCGLYHSVVIGKRGDVPQLYGWGRNHNNVLALGPDVAERSFPCQIPYFAKSHVLEVSCGLNHTVVVIKQPSASGGKVYACGLGNRGRLGFTKSDTLEETAETDAWFTPKPIRVRFPNREKISRVSCGSDHTLATTDKGDLFAWGVGQYGNLGTGQTHDEYFPVKVACGPKDTVIIHCAAGGKHSLACSSDGRCYAWGHGGNGRLGLGHSRAALVPTVLDYVVDREVAYVAAGEAHSACIDKLGVLYTWGAGAYGRLGHGEDVDIPVPRKVEEFGGIPIIQVACGTFHTLAVAKSGALYSWGAGLGVGLIAEGETTSVMVPKQVQEGQIGSTICQVAAGTYHSIALSLTGDVFCWGVGGQSRLGHGDNVNQPFPRRVAELRNRAFVDDIKAMFMRSAAPPPRAMVQTGGEAWRVTSIQCGRAHTMIMCANGDVWVWGSNDMGQLGLAETFDETYEPVQLKVFRDPVRRIACGLNHSMAASARGELFVWGDGSQGQLGLGRITDAFTPTGITTLTGVFAIGAGDDYSACLTAPKFGGGEEGIFAEAGDLWTWGSCETGKLGHEGLSSGSCVAPKRVQMSVPISKVACGRGHMVACSPNGDVLAWGAGYYGRLGNASSANSPVPIRIPFPDGVFIVDVAAGAFHSMALADTGSIWVWGRDIAVCAKEHLKSPQLFEALEGPEGPPKCKLIYCAAEHSFAVTVTGELWAWGDNRNFQLGVGKKAQEFLFTPDLITGLDDAVDVLGTSITHTIVALRRGATYAWGSTTSGCLGSGYKRTKFVHLPEPVDARWTEGATMVTPGRRPEAAALPLLRGQADVQALQEKGEAAFETGIEDKVMLFLDRLRFSAEPPSFSAVQELLKSEPRSNQYAEIKSFEDDFVRIFARFLNVILEMPELEKEWRDLEYRLEQQFTRVIVNVDCCSPLVITDPRLVAPDFYMAKLEKIQYLTYCLQMQPAYLVSLAAAIRTEFERQVLLTSIRQIFWDVDDAHVNATFLGLAAAVCDAEVEMAPDLLNLFKPRESTFVNLFSMYATMGPSLGSFAHNLVDPSREGGAAFVMESLGDQYLALDVDKLQELAAAGSISLPKDMQRAFYASLEGIAAVLHAVPQSLQLPVGVCALFKHAYDSIVAHELVLVAGAAHARDTLNSYYPLVRLLLQGVVGRLWKDPARYRQLLMCPPAESAAAETNYRTLWVYVNSAFEDDFVNYRSAHLLREIFHRVYFALSETAAAMINRTPDGYIRVQATLGFYYTHFSNKTHFVTLRSDTMAFLINRLKEYEARLQLSVYDPVAETLKAISTGVGPIFTREMIHQLEERPYYHNVYIDRRFLLKERNAVIDPLTAVVVPQLLAFRQQAAVQEGRAVIALVQRYVAPDPLDPRAIIEGGLRQLPPVSAKTWERLAAEFEAFQEYFTRQQPPDYPKAQLASKAQKYASDFDNREQPTVTLLKWLGDGLRRRQKHRTYLELVQAGEETVSNWERLYRFDLQRRTVSLKTAVETMRELDVEPQVRSRLQAAKIVPKIEVIAARVGTGHPEDARPTITIPLRALLRAKVALSAEFQPAVLPRVSMVWTAAGQGAWVAQVTESTRLGERSIDQFTVTATEVLRLRGLPPATPVTYGARLVVFQAAELALFLVRASVQPVRPNL